MLRCNTWTGRLALVGLAALIGCGGKAQAPDAVSSPPSPRPVLQPTQPGNGRAGGGDVVSAGAAPPGGNEAVPAVDDTLLNQPTVQAMPAAEITLLYLCGSCHGPEAIAKGNVQGGFDAIKDVDRMIQLGLVVPLHSAESRLVQMLRDGSMPPPGVEPRPTDIDIEIVAAFIDNPLFWDVPLPVTPALDGGAAVASEDAAADGG
jgi:mono/diheme cytochrome c family protein